MPSSSMNDPAWNETNTMSDMSRQHGIGTRSQDDAMVSYLFQRPQGNTGPPQGYGGGKRWAVGDDSVIPQVRSVSELERDFQELGFNDNRELGGHPKKLWGDSDMAHKGGGDAGKPMFHGSNPWNTRDDTWGSAPTQQVPETGALGVNMAEYVLGGSPVGKDLDPRIRMKVYASAGGEVKNDQVEKSVKAASPFEGEVVKNDQDVGDVQSNGIISNGLEERGSRQTSPAEEEQQGLVMGVPNQVQHQQVVQMPQMVQRQSVDDYQNDFSNIGQAPPQHHFPPQSGLHLEAPQFEPNAGIAIDTIQFPDYSNPMMQSMDSPSYDYSQQVMRQQQPQQQQLQQQQQQGPQIAILTQQQYALANQQHQQLGLAPTAFAPTPYVINAQDPYAVGIPIAAAGPTTVMPQYYSVQTPWGIYPAASLIQQQGTPGQQTPQGQGPMTPVSQQGQQPQQNIMPRQGGRLTPSQQQQELNTPTGNLPVQQPTTIQGGYQILAPAYYDQSGQLVMGNGRGLGTPVRLVPQAPILVNAGAQNQQANGIGPGNSLRLLTTPQQQMQTTQGAYSSSSSTPQNTPLGDGYTPTSNMYTPASNSLFTPMSNTLGLTAPQQQSGLAGGYSSGSLGTIGTTATPGAIGSGLGSGNRLYNAAPGAEAKFRNGPLSSNNNYFGNSLFQSRVMAKNQSMSKEVTGRSRLLEDFRNNRIPNLQLKDLMKHVVEFSQDQHGSRFIQQKLERASPSEKAMVFNEILSAAYGLMTDVFGNYVIQKFFEFGTPEQKQTLAQRVRGHVLQLALQMYGCRVIQKALESIPSEMQVEIVLELDGHVLKCVKDQNGNHVVQKCIECVDPSQLQFIIDAFKGQVFALSTHPYGCRVIQRILEHCTAEQTTPILDELHSHVERLVQDQYGNYVIQHVLEHGRSEDKSKIVNEISGKVLSLAQHKFASNVVEKCVSHSSRNERALLIEEVCSINDGPHSALYTMMKDQFANYVVQKMIDVAEPAQRKLLMHKIRPHVATLRKYTYGKHILAKIEKYYMKNSPEMGPLGLPPNSGMQ